MVEPVVLTGALLWLGKEIAAQGIRRFMDWVFDSPGPAGQQVARRQLAAGQRPAPIRRFDLSRGAQVTSHMDVAVRFAEGAGQRLPVILAFQEAHGATKGEPFPMVLTDTAHVTLRRADYLISALVLLIPREPGTRPTLRGIGWERRWVAGNDTEKVLIGTNAPTKKLVKQLGLVDADGTPLFSLPAPKALPAAPPAAQRRAITGTSTALPGSPASEILRRRLLDGTTPTRSSGTPRSATPRSGTQSGTPRSGTQSGTPRSGTPSGTPRSGGTPSGTPRSGTPSGTPRSGGTPSGTPRSGTPPLTPFGSELLRRLSDGSAAGSGATSAAGANTCVARGLGGERCRFPGTPQGGYRLCLLHGAQASAGQLVRHHLSGRRITLPPRR